MEDFMSNIRKPNPSNLNNLDDSLTDIMVERDHLDITEFCMTLDAIEVIDDMMFNYLEDK